MKGYISKPRGIVVLSKGGAFPGTGVWVQVLARPPFHTGVGGQTIEFAESSIPLFYATSDCFSVDYTLVEDHPSLAERIVIKGLGEHIQPSHLITHTITSTTTPYPFGLTLHCVVICVCLVHHLLVLHRAAPLSTAQNGLVPDSHTTAQPSSKPQLTNHIASKKFSDVLSHGGEASKGSGGG